MNYSLGVVNITSWVNMRTLVGNKILGMNLNMLMRLGFFAKYLKNHETDLQTIFFS